MPAKVNSKLLTQPTNKPIQDRGIELAEGLTLSPMPFASTSGNMRDAWESLPSEEARVKMLDEFIERLDRLFAHDWGAMYEMIALIRDYPQYWQDKGYVSFEVFWQEKGSFAFEQLRELEHNTGFGNVACPELFVNGAVLPRMKQFNEEPSRLEKPAEIAGDERAGILWHLDLDNESKEYKRGYLDGRNAGSRCKRLRFQLLKSEFPRIAKAILQRKFFKRKLNGGWRLDLCAAEKSVGIEKKKRKMQSPASRAAKIFSKLNDADRQEFIKLIGL